MIVRLLITLISIVALPILVWHPIEAADAKVQEKQVYPATLASSGLRPPSFSTSEIIPDISSKSDEGELNEDIVLESSPAGFVPV
jgi:hypothetical protein